MKVNQLCHLCNYISFGDRISGEMFLRRHYAQMMFSNMGPVDRGPSASTGSKVDRVVRLRIMPAETSGNFGGKIVLTILR